MDVYSQNNEQNVIENFFGQYMGTLLSIGENSGIHLSNVYSLLCKGWIGDLVEPSPQVFIDLEKLHSKDEHVYCHQLAIGDRNEMVDLYDSGELLGVGDRALVSTVKKEETERWTSLKIPFKQVQVQMVTFASFMEDYAMFKTYDLISLDAEGMDLDILRQINLEQVGCKCICVEHNSYPHVLSQIKEYCAPFGLKNVLTMNAENIILTV